jgi:hypothetical protein
MVQPAAVSGCNVDIENLITDPNRSIATYAITTLLKVRMARLKECKPQILIAGGYSDRKRGLGRSPYEANFGLHDRNH